MHNGMPELSPVWQRAASTVAGMETYLASGRVVDRSTGLPIAGLHVRAYDQDPVRPKGPITVPFEKEGRNG
jgi:hypothetical protein